MPKIKKGLETQNKIIETAKKLFYEKGFDKTTIKEICEITKIKPGNFNYYYKTKEDLLKSIYSDLYMKTYAFVGSKVDRPINSIEKNVFTTYPYTMALFHDENTLKFHHEIISCRSIAFYLGENFNHVYKQFFRDLNRNIPSVKLNNLINGDLGMRREVTLAYIEHPEDQSLFDLIDTFLIFRARLMQMDEVLMKSYLYNALEFERNNDHSHIKLLI